MWKVGEKTFDCDGEWHSMIIKHTVETVPDEAAALTLCNRRNTENTDPASVWIYWQEKDEPKPEQHFPCYFSVYK